MPNQKVALVLGCTGQDGSYCMEFLLKKGYIVHGIIRRSSNFNTQRIDHIFDQITLHYGDLTDKMSLFRVISEYRPHEIYNFGAMSHVKVSSELEDYTFETNTLGMLSILQCVKTLGLEKHTKIYHASTSEQYGNQTDGTVLLNEDSPMNPISIYGISKLAAQHLCNMYRDAFGMFVISSVLFNHESSNRGHTFVTKKITDYIKKYQKDNNVSPLELGNLNAKRDWGFSQDYIEAIWMMMQQRNPENYVIATGETHSVREFVELAFKCINIEITWRGVGLLEQGICKDTKKILVTINDRYFRDIEIECLIGDSSKAKRILNWEPKTSFEELVTEMVEN
jgi:GDPmannose 4,6-dehydratase